MPKTQKKRTGTNFGLLGHQKTPKNSEKLQKFAKNFHALRQKP